MERYNNLFAARFFQTLFLNSTIKKHFEELTAKRGYIFTLKELVRLLIDSFPEYNYQELNSHLECFTNRFNGRNVNFYDVLFDFSDSMIVRSDNKYCFKYEYTDIWRELTKNLGEELFVISAIVQMDFHRGQDNRIDYDWVPCIEHDNHELKAMLRRGKGVSENHLHLRGSSSYFDVSWVFLMNNISSKKYEDNIERIEKNILNYTSTQPADYSLKLMWRKAAVLRLLLFQLIEKGEMVNDEEKFLQQEQKNKRDKPSEDKQKTDRDSHVEEVSLENLFFDTIVPYDFDGICRFPVARVQDMINVLNKTGTIDYAHVKMRGPYQKYFSISGERYIIYQCLHRILLQGRDCRTIEQLLFLYVLIKRKFYSEMIQSNKRIGFFNFSQYQARKDYFIPFENEKLVATETICSIIEINKIHRAELRISPCRDSIDNTNMIRMYDEAIIEAAKRVEKLTEIPCDKKSELEKKFFYTIHFTKRKDELQPYQCRHQGLRRDIEMKADALLSISPDLSKRIYGIDAAGQEIDCRPEVFAPTFRYLRNYAPDSFEADRQLRITYHVGEDNYDVADGLRAIDEAITYLDMRSGCRLGHATLLGIDPYFYYKEIKDTVSMPRQIFLDNVVWMYFFLRENSIHFDDIAHLMSYLDEKFHYYFHTIYGDVINSELVDEKLSEFADHSCYASFPEGSVLNREHCKFDIYHYYYSYLLRGDEPSLYRDGFIRKRCNGTQIYKICSSKSQMKKARGIFEAVYLYYAYHYNPYVKKRGMEKIDEKLPEFLIHGLALIQNKLKQKLSFAGIAIETNPSSNLFISSITDYSQHPIVNFYDNGLVRESGKLQLNVSINTDDKGVFATNLSNEYAYLLFYLENKVDANGNQLFSRFEIMQWLDNIRKMGNEQSFAD